jgi:hypothetical protein
MTHTYTDPAHSTFQFGAITARVEFSGDVHNKKTADIMRWSFGSVIGGHNIDLTASMEALDDAMTDAGLADVFRSLHCPRAARELGR